MFTTEFIDLTEIDEKPKLFWSLNGFRHIIISVL